MSGATHSQRRIHVLLMLAAPLACDRSAGGVDPAQLSHAWAAAESSVYCPGGMAVIPSMPLSQGVDNPAYCLDITEATVAQWRACEESGACPPAGSGKHPRAHANTWFMEDDQLPMNYVSGVAAAAYCAWRGGRIPTMTEWGWAFISGSSASSAPWGAIYLVPEGDGDARKNSPPGPVCNGEAQVRSGVLSRNDALPCRVASSFGDHTRQGVFDMVGNLSEWVMTEDRKGPGRHACSSFGDFTSYYSDPGGLPTPFSCGPRGDSSSSMLDGVRCAADTRMPTPPPSRLPCFEPDAAALAEARAIVREAHRLVSDRDFATLVAGWSERLHPRTIRATRAHFGTSVAEVRERYRELTGFKFEVRFENADVAPLPESDDDIVFTCYDSQFTATTRDGLPVLRQASAPEHSVEICLVRADGQWLFAC